MSKSHERRDWLLLSRLLSRWRASYIGRVAAVVEIASVPASALGIYYALATVTLSSKQLLSLAALVALFVTVANFIGVFYARRNTTHLRRFLQMMPDRLPSEEEEAVWREATAFPWQFSLFALYNSTLVVVLPVIVLSYWLIGIQPAFLPYLFIGGFVVVSWISIYYYFVWEWLFWPVRQALLPRSPSLQHEHLKGASVQNRLMLVLHLTGLTTLIMIASIVYQKSGQAAAPGANPVLVLQNLRGHVLFIALLGLLLTVAFSILLARSVATPIQRLTATMTEVGAGKLGLRGQLVSTDEVGRLTIAFNQMVSQLEMLHAGLEEQVAQRTADLVYRTRQLEAAAYVARRAAEIRDVDTLLNETVRLISDRFGFYHAGIFLLDEAGEYAVLRAASSKGGQRMLARGHRLAVGKVGIVGTVAGTGLPRIALDVGEDAVFFDNPDLPLTRSELALPLKVGERVVGVLDVQSEESAAFTERDVAVLQTMADQIALAIENARLLGQMQRAVQELERLYGEYTQEVWRSPARQAGGLLGLRYRYPLVEPLQDVPEEARRVLSEGRSAVYPIREEGDGRVSGALLAVPVRLRGQTIGALNIRFAVGEPPPEAVRLVEEVADRLALALENARLLQESRQRAVWEQTLARITDRIRAEAEIESILERALEELGYTLGAERAYVQLTGLAAPPATPVRGGDGGQEVLR